MLRVRDIMKTDVVTVTPEMTVREAMDLFASRHLSGAPVVIAGKVLGIVSATDLMDFAASLPGVPTARPEDDTAELEAPQIAPDEDVPPQAYFVDQWDDAGADVVERMNETDGPEWNVLEQHIVQEAMTQSIVSLPPDTPVELAADKMRETGVHRLLVMQDSELLGIVSTKDIADAVADHKLTGQRYVFTRKDSATDRTFG